MKSTNYITIQRTAKRYKVMKIVAFVLFAVSIIGAGNGAEAAPALFVASIALAIFAKIGVWWDHS